MPENARSFLCGYFFHPKDTNPNSFLFVVVSHPKVTNPNIGQGFAKVHNSQTKRDETRERERERRKRFLCESVFSSLLLGAGINAVECK
jgi:hypothetical protein